MKTTYLITSHFFWLKIFSSDFRLEQYWLSAKTTFSTETLTLSCLISTHSTLLQTNTLHTCILYSPPPNTRVGSLHCSMNWRQRLYAVGVRLKESMGSPLSPSAPHWHTKAWGENTSRALCKTLLIKIMQYRTLYNRG